MGDMIVSKQDLYIFLQLLQLQGNIANIEGVFEFKKDRIETLLISSDKSVALRGKLKGDFVENEKIGVDNIGLLKDLISSFPDKDLCIAINKNKLQIYTKNNKLKVKYILKNPEYILNNIDNEKFDSIKKQAVGNGFTLSTDIISNIITYFNKIKAQELILSGENKTLTLQIEQNENEILSTFDLPNEVQPFKTKIGKIFIDLLSTIKSEVNISILTSKPIYLILNTDSIALEAIVAPLKTEDNTK